MNVWNVLYVSSRQEKRIQERLTENGIETYVPLKKVLSQWSDRKKWVTYPLIKGYVFVKVNELNRDVIFQTPGVVSLLKYSGKAAVVRQTEIDTLKEIEKLGYEITTIVQEFNVGDEALISQGPLKDRLVKVLKITNDHCICVFLLENIGHHFKIKLPLTVLQNVRQPTTYS
jgi:transcription antitermination factor NusG